MSKTLDMFQPGSNANIIRNGIFVGSLLITGELTVNSLKVLEVNQAYITSNASNYGPGIGDIFSDLSIAYVSNLISNYEYSISNLYRELYQGIGNLNNISISSLDQVGNGTSNKFIMNNTYDSSLNIVGVLNADYLRGDGLLLKNVNLNDRTTDYLSEGNSNLYFTNSRFAEVIRGINTDNIRIGTSNQYIVNGVYDGDLVVTGELTASRVSILDMLTNVLNSNFDPDVRIGSNTYVHSLASFIRSVNANLMNDIKFLDNKLNLVMTCNMDETLLGMIANDSNILINTFTQTINFVDSNIAGLNYFVTSNVHMLNTTVNNNISNLIDYVNSNISRVDYHYVLEGSNMQVVLNVINMSNAALNTNITNKINALSTNNIIEGNNLYFTYKRAGALAYSSNLNVSNYVDTNFVMMQNVLQSSNTNISNYIASVNEKYLNIGRNASNYIDVNTNILNTALSTSNYNLSNYVNMHVNNIHNKIDALDLDDIAQGSNNTFIKNNVYDGYLIVTGGIITTNVLIYDMNDPLLTRHISNTSNMQTNTSNAYVNGIEYMLNKINTQSVTIDLLTSNLTSALNRISQLENMIYS